QRELELRARRPAAEADILCRLHEQPRALDLLQFRSQPGDDLLRAGGALVARLQGDEEVAVVAGAATAADRHGDGRNIWIGLHDLAERLLMADHVLEGD